ncbi:pwi domain protein mRNA processing [Grosmannia clavigera kw1407]|uniref:Pwi domain protein mRNA processing n=1 Tax=Grosmannia clavigera (strain kw1407 / UAMH 11150) TaxID=655863 RepID=F0XHH3_GROCL|nr:pwi domain protein mRNA processing [Grosmannia clavigera kw1407]EFX03258.1 pwi domain protein mRNA processing [Grosmannia clavigera kw1407]
MERWIAGKIAAILGNDDDVVIELCYNLIESSRNPDIKALQIQLTGFLESETPTFCNNLWTSKPRRPQKNLAENTRAAGVLTARLEATTVAIPGGVALVVGAVARKHKTEEEEEAEEEVGAGTVLVHLPAADVIFVNGADFGQDTISTFPVIVVAAVVGETMSGRGGRLVDLAPDRTHDIRSGLTRTNRRLVLAPVLIPTLARAPRHGAD